MPKPQNQRYARLTLSLPAQQPLRADSEHVTDDEHSDHQRRIDRGAANREDSRAPARRAPPTDRERQQSRARGDPPAPPRRGRTNRTAAPGRSSVAPSWQSPPLNVVRRRNHCSTSTATHFCNKICQDRPQSVPMSMKQAPSTSESWITLAALSCPTGHSGSRAGRARRLFRQYRRLATNHGPAHGRRRCADRCHGVPVPHATDAACGNRPNRHGAMPTNRR